MTNEDFTQLKYWFDLGIKALIGIVVSIVGMDYRAVKNSLSELQETKYHLTAEVSVVRNELQSMKERLQRIESKIDRLTERK
jgi:predicted nuclease with TOPRIM domain